VLDEKCNTRALAGPYRSRERALASDKRPFTTKSRSCSLRRRPRVGRLTTTKLQTRRRPIYTLYVILLDLFSLYKQIVRWQVTARRSATAAQGSSRRGC